MTDLEKIRSWILTFPGIDRLQSLQVDYLPKNAETGGITPSGLTEISRTEDMIGNVTAENQYIFGLYYVLTKTEETAQANAQWILDLQRWVQEQSIRHLAPTFGDKPETERINAQNGVLYAENEDGTATYLVQLTANFTKFYEVI